MVLQTWAGRKSLIVHRTLLSSCPFLLMYQIVIDSNANINFRDAFRRSSRCLRPFSDLVKCQTSDLYVYHASRLYDRTLFSTAFYSHSNQLLTIPRPSSPSIYVVKSTFGLPGLYKSVRTLVSCLEDIRASVTRSQSFGKFSGNRRKCP